MRYNNFRTLTVLSAVLTSGVLYSPALATLIPLGAFPNSGGGPGAGNTSITFQNIGTEIGAVGLLPGGGGQVIGSTVAFGIPGFPSVGGATDETAGNAGANLYTASGLGLVAGTSTTFSNLVLLFNGNEGGNALDEPIVLTDLSLNLFSPAGALLGSFTMSGPYTVNGFFDGPGTVGFGFGLDTAEAAQANAWLLSNPDLVIGTAARATGANSGPETISFLTLPAAGVPDSGGTVALLGLGVMIAGITRRLRR